MTERQPNFRIDENLTFKMLIAIFKYRSKAPHITGTFLKINIRYVGKRKRIASIKTES